MLASLVLQLVMVVGSVETCEEGRLLGGGRLLLVAVLIICLRKMMSGPLSCSSANPSAKNTESSALDIGLSILLLGLYIISSSLDDELRDSLKILFLILRKKVCYNQAEAELCQAQYYFN